MARLRISPKLALPEDAVTETFAFLAKRGAGKTYAATVLVEEMLKAKLQVVVLDPIGAWWGLRSSADGKGKGFPIAILGGERGDVPLEQTAGELVADLVMNERVSVILDLSEFRKSESKRFVVDFAERLYRKNREALHLVLEEADLFAPQRPMRGEERMLGAIEDLVRRGRGRGVGISLVTQRSAVVNKDVLTQTECLVALRTTHKRDRAAIEDWIETHGEEDEKAEVLSSLPGLPIGTAWFWSPGWLGMLKQVQIRQRKTFDSSATPKPGQRRRRPKTVADVDLDSLKKQMTATIEKSKAEDPKALKREIARMQKELQTRPTETVVETEVERVEVPVFENGLLDRLDTAVARIGDVGAELVAVAREVGSTVESATASSTRSGGPMPAEQREPVRQQRRARTERRRAPATETDEVQLRRGERKMLEVLAQRHPLRVTPAQWATLSGFAVRGGTFRTYRGVLRGQGFIEEAGDEIAITDAGFDYLGLEEPPPPQTTQEVLSMWRSVLRAGERAMLDVLVEHYPDYLTREELAEATGFAVTGGTFRTYVGVLARNGLIEVDGDEIKASETFFLTGARART